MSEKIIEMKIYNTGLRKKVLLTKTELIFVSEMLEGRTYKQDPDVWEKNGGGAFCKWESPLRGNVFSQESKPAA